jgi:integrase/recombinase XerD
VKCLFNQRYLERIFKNTSIQVKDLRKFFSQEWDRRGGPTSIKKILMGHSLKNDVDLMHYNAQSEEDLKKIYDRVMGEKTGYRIIEGVG